MTDEAAKNITTRIGIIDRLINTQGSSLNDLFRKGQMLEEQLRTTDPNYTSRLTDQINRFKELNSSYKH